MRVLDSESVARNIQKYVELDYTAINGLSGREYDIVLVCRAKRVTSRERRFTYIVRNVDLRGNP